MGGPATLSLLGTSLLNLYKPYRVDFPWFPVETELQRILEEEAGDDIRIATWRNWEGEWVVSWVVGGDDFIMDLLHAGRDEAPRIDQNILISCLSAIRAREFGKGPMARAFEGRENRHVERIEEQADWQKEYLAKQKQVLGSSSKWVEHPIFQNV